MDASSRAGWSLKEYEDAVASLLLHQKALVSHDEENQQTIFDLKKKLNVKVAMEGEYVGEIAELNSTIEKLQVELKEKKSSLTALQRSLDLAQHEIEDLKETEVPIVLPEPERPVIRQQMNELPKGPDVSWEEWNNLKDKVETLEQGLGESKLNREQLQTTNATLIEDVTSWEIRASQLAFECANAKEAYADVFGVLEDYKAQLSTAHEELTLLSEQPMQPGQRGNSLFGEVEDNRKEIARRFAELKNKYLALTVQCRRNAFNPSAFATERAGLQKLVAEVEAIHEQRDELEIESLRSRIRVQDELIRHLNTQQRAPIRVMNAVGKAEVEYMEAVLSDCKKNERELETKLNEISTAHLLTQEELIACKSNLAKANTQLVQELAKNRILHIDQTIAEANKAEPELGDDTVRPVADAEPMDVPGSSQDVRRPATPVRASPGTKMPAIKELDEPQAGPSVAPPATMPEIQLLVIAPAGPVEDLNYDETRHTPPLCLPAPTIRGSQRYPTFAPIAFPARGSSKRRASLEAALSLGDSDEEGSDAGKRRRHSSGPARVGQHVRRLDSGLDCAEVQGRPAKPKAVSFVDKPDPVEAGDEKPAETRVPIEIEEVTDVVEPKYARVHIPGVKRQKMGDTRDKN